MPEHVDDVLRSSSGLVLARGREYAAQGRVVELTDEGGVTRAIVRGSQASRYDVALGPDRADCTCPAYAREGECKHLVAVAFALREERRPTLLGAPPLPAIFRDVYATGTFLTRLALHAGSRLDVRVEQWLPLGDWWRRATKDSEALRARVLAHAKDIEGDLETLRAWTPPPNPQPGTVYGDIYEKLAQRYVAGVSDVRIKRAAPGPLGRHEGFDVAYDSKKRVLVLSEKPSRLLADPLTFTVRLPREPNDAIRIDEIDSFYGPVDAWALFALRALLFALHDRELDAVRELVAELGKPVWEHVLERLATKRTKRAEIREWAFCLVAGYRSDYLLYAFARESSPTKIGRWRKQPFDALYGEDVAPTLRDIARVALAAVDYGETPSFHLATPQGYELCRALAAHPRVTLGERKPDPDRDPPVQIVAGPLSMQLEPSPSGALLAHFMLGHEEVSPTMLAGSEAFRGSVRGSTIFAAYVPAPLRPWLAAAAQMGDALSFPPEAVNKLVATTEPLVSAGVAVVSKTALGAELAYEPKAALRVEWRLDGAAVIEPMISPHPDAPLATPGHGAQLFTFETAGRRVFVERELDREIPILEEAISRIEAPITWENAMGRTESFEDAIALAEWLDRNPLGLVIEVKVGRPPTLVSWSAARRTLRVSNEGAWLKLDGEIEAGDVKLTIGDVLEAARLARRYVKAENGVFLELSKEAIARLQPVAIAAELGDGEKVHDGFGDLVAQVQSLFERVEGADLAAYARRFEQRTKAAKIAKLERGKLRDYQREGTAWMLALSTWAPGCVLADDMGLGKTVQTASVLKTRAVLGPALIVAPASVSSNWIAELERFMPSLSVRWFNEQRNVDDVGPGDVVVVSYGLLPRLPECHWSTVVVDEAQYVKNVGAQRTDAVRSLKRDFTICLTGTPLENHLGELYSIVDLAFPGLLGSEAVFREKFRRPIEGRGDTARLEALGRMLAPFLLRRTRASVLRELPPREEITEYVDLSAEERKRYLALRRACEEQFGKRKRGETPAQFKIALLAALTRLRQLACDVRLVDPAFPEASTKIVRAVDLASQIAAEGNRVLVFSQFTQFLEKVKAAMTDAGLRVAHLAGDTPTAKRRPIIDAFQAGAYDVFCISLLAGGTGLNLTKASYVIHLDPWWNPAAEEQATSRSHRMGQDAPVTVYRLVSRGTIEEAVLDMQAHKRDLATAVLEGKARATAITPEELLDLLRFG